jgi:hypothetical protein
VLIGHFRKPRKNIDFSTKIFDDKIAARNPAAPAEVMRRLPHVKREGF